MDDKAQQLAAYLRHRKALIDYATPIVGERATAEDIVQEAWLRFSGVSRDATAQVRPQVQKPVNYLYRIVRNLAIDVTRRLSPEVRGEAAEEVMEHLSDDAVGPEDSLLWQDELRATLAAIETLPDLSRKALYLHRFRGLTYEAIAAELGVSQGQAYNLVRDAVAQCLHQLARRRDQA
ncbi:MAG: sigma-70 family RNA polymerase sigma factor [Asticcacaulis sp.]